VENQLTSSRGHQGAHGIGQVEKQLNRQAQAAEEIQGTNHTDQEIIAASHEQSSVLEEIVDTESE
jgi:methyl-accepting chemotaxis protein